MIIRRNVRLMALGIMVAVPLQFTHASVADELAQKVSTLAIYTAENASKDVKEQPIKESFKTHMVAAKDSDDSDRPRERARDARDRLGDRAERLGERAKRFDDDDRRFDDDRFFFDDDRFRDDDFRRNFFLRNELLRNQVLRNQLRRDRILRNELRRDRFIRNQPRRNRLFNPRFRDDDFRFRRDRFDD